MSCFFLLMLIFLPLGLLLLWLAQRKKGLILKNSDQRAEIRLCVLRKPWQELPLGLIFTFAGLYFVKRIVTGENAWILAISAAALIAVFSSWGAYHRCRIAWQTLALDPAMQLRLLRWQGCFCLAQALLLLGLLSAFAWRLSVS